MRSIHAFICEFHEMVQSFNSETFELELKPPRVWELFNQQDRINGMDNSPESV